MSISLNDEYYKKAYEAYENKEYKYCLILLNKLSLDDRKYVSLLVDCSYEYWKVVRIIEEQSDDILINKIKDNFTKLLSNPSLIEIKPFDYIRLSHVYLSEGSYDGALKIMQLASARGYLEDPTIILQSWTVMRRISIDLEAQGTMTYLTSTLIFEANQRKRDKNSNNKYTTSLLFISDSTLPMYYLYLHCASFVFKQALNTKDVKSIYKSHMNEFYAILSEAYYIAFSIINENVKSLYNWFNEVELWLMMGKYLDNGTPFVLLAHDSYWEAFIRAPLDEISMRLLIKSMLKCNRKQDIPQLLARAMEVNPWNVYVRDVLVTIESEIKLIPEDQHWRLLFYSEHIDLTKIQGSYRSWLLKRQWPTIKKKQQVTCKLHRERMKLANEMHRSYWKLLLKNQISIWKAYIDNWKYLKYVSARCIQAYWRRYSWYRWYYYWEKPRIYYINTLNIIACQLKYDQIRAQFFRLWYSKYYEKLKQKSADLILNVLYMNGYSIILRKGMDFMLTMLRVKNKNLFKSMFKHWKHRYHVRILKKARVSIRFYIRNLYYKKELKLKLQQYEIIEAKLEEKKNSIKYKENNMPLIKEMWYKWKYQYKIIQIKKAKLFLSYHLTKLFYRYKGRKLLRILRIRYENQITHIYFKWRKQISNIFKPWQLITSINRIQRFIRIYQAKKILLRLQNISINVKKLLKKNRKYKLLNMLWRIQKYVYLYKRMKIRASYYIVKLFRLIIKRSIIRNCCRKKIKSGKFLWKLNHIYTNNIFHNLKMNTIYVLKRHHLNILYEIMRRKVLWFHLNYWMNSIKKQQQIDSLINIFINHSIDRKFGIYANQSISILPLQQYKHNNNRYNSNNSSIYSSLQNNISLNLLFQRASKQLKINNINIYNQKLKFKFIWEKVISKQLILYDISQITLIKAFKAWMIHYRSRKHTLHSVLTDYSIYFINNSIESGVNRRKVACVRIQCLYRLWKTKKYLSIMINKYRKYHENHLCMNGKEMHRNVHYMYTIQKIRSQARIQLQCFIRIYLAKCKVQKLVNNNEKLINLESMVDSSRIQKSLVKKYLHMIQTCYCDIIFNRIFDSKTQQQKYKDSNSTRNYTYQNSFILKTKKKNNKQSIKSYNEVNNHYDRIISDNQSDESDNDDNAYLTKNEKLIKKYEKSKLLKHQASNNNKSNPIKLKDKNKILQIKKEVLFDIDIIKNRSFQSTECHQHLLRLKENGIFIYDYNNHHLTNDEIIFCIQHADIIFYQMTGKIDLEIIKNYFIGNKLVICGGWLTDSTAIHVLPHIVTHSFEYIEQTTNNNNNNNNNNNSTNYNNHTTNNNSTNNNNNNTTNNNTNITTTNIVNTNTAITSYEAVNHTLCLHITSIRMQLNTKLAFIYAIMDLPSTTTTTTITEVVDVVATLTRCCRLREISIDSDSIGILTLPILVRALEYNHTLEVLIIKCNEIYLLPSMAKSIKALSNNPSLQDLRLYGCAVMCTSILENIIQAVQQHKFHGLINLEFSIDPSILLHILLAEKLIDLAKDRAYVGRKGLSVTINYH